MIRRILVAALAAAVIVGVVAVLAHQRRQVMLRQSEPFQTLARLESQQDHAGLNARLLELASRPPSSALREQNRLLGIWLSPRVGSPHIPTLYLIAKSYENQGRLREAGAWYLKAALTGRVDAARCSDSTSVQAIVAMESLFRWTTGHLRKHERQRRAGVAAALAYEESVRDRPPARWICAHGLASFRGDSLTTDGGTWQARRARIRSEFH